MPTIKVSNAMTPNDQSILCSDQFLFLKNDFYKRELKQIGEETHDVKDDIILFW